MSIKMSEVDNTEKHSASILPDTKVFKDNLKEVAVWFCEKMYKSNVSEMPDWTKAKTIIQEEK